MSCRPFRGEAYSLTGLTLTPRMAVSKGCKTKMYTLSLFGHQPHFILAFLLKGYTAPLYHLREQLSFGLNIPVAWFLTMAGSKCIGRHSGGLQAGLVSRMYMYVPQSHKKTDRRSWWLLMPWPRIRGNPVTPPPWHQIGATFCFCFCLP
jgi:hypothetical protein